MNKQQLAGIVLAATLASTGVLAACGSSDPATDAKPNTSTSTTADPTPSAPATPTSPADLTLSPGAAGPVLVGMSKTDVTATGLFESDVPSPVEGCPVHALLWIKPFASTFDVEALANGEVASIGVHQAGPKTASGLGIGSTYADVLAANPSAKAIKAGYGQTGILVHDASTGGWIGFLFDAKPKNIKATDIVSFIELTHGEKPSLMRDGC